MTARAMLAALVHIADRVRGEHAGLKGDIDKIARMAIAAAKQAGVDAVEGQVRSPVIRASEHLSSERRRGLEEAAIELWTRFHISPIQYDRDASSWPLAKAAKYGPTDAYEDAALTVLHSPSPSSEGDSGAGAPEAAWKEVFEAQKSIIGMLVETLHEIKRNDRHYNFGSKLNRLVDGTLSKLPPAIRSLSASSHDWSPDTHLCRKCGAPINTQEACLAREQVADNAARDGAVAKRSVARSEPPSSEGGEEKPDAAALERALRDMIACYPAGVSTLGDDALARAQDLLAGKPASPDPIREEILEAHIANLTRFNIPGSIKWEQACRAARAALPKHRSGG